MQDSEQTRHLTVEVSSIKSAKAWGAITVVFSIIMMLPVVLGVLALAIGALSGGGSGAMGVYFIWLFSVGIAGVLAIPGLVATTIYLKKAKPKGVKLAGVIAILAVAGNVVLIAVPILFVMYVLPLFLK